MSLTRQEAFRDYTKYVVQFTDAEEIIHQDSQLLAREVVAWKWLQHENVLPFVGVTREFAIVSDFMENGNIMMFITEHPRHNRFNLVISGKDQGNPLYSGG